MCSPSVKEDIDRWLKTCKHICFHCGWLDACIEWLIEEHGRQVLSQRQHVKDLVYEQWLLGDLREISPGCLPSWIASGSSGVLKGTYCLQVKQVINVGEPAYAQLQRLKGRENEDVKFTTGKQNAQEAKPSRMLMMELTDGVHIVRGMEHHTIGCLSIDLPPGCKLKIKGNVRCRRATLLLNNSHVEHLGGQVEALLEANMQQAVLTQALGLDGEEATSRFSKASRHPLSGLDSNGAAATISGSSALTTEHSSVVGARTTPSARRNTVTQKTGGRQMRTLQMDTAEDFDDMELDALTEIEQQMALELEQNDPSSPSTHASAGKKSLEDKRRNPTSANSHRGVGIIARRKHVDFDEFTEMEEQIEMELERNKSSSSFSHASIGKAGHEGKRSQATTTSTHQGVRATARHEDGKTEGTMKSPSDKKETLSTRISQGHVPPKSKLLIAEEEESMFERPFSNTDSVGAQKRKPRSDQPGEVIDLTDSSSKPNVTSSTSSLLSRLEKKQSMMKSKVSDKFTSNGWSAKSSSSREKIDPPSTPLCRFPPKSIGGNSDDLSPVTTTSAKRPYQPLALTKKSATGLNVAEVSSSSDVHQFKSPNPVQKLKLLDDNVYLTAARDNSSWQSSTPSKDKCDIHRPPFTYLKLVKGHMPVVKKELVWVKSFLATLTSKLRNSNGWGVSAIINDGSDTLEVDFSNEVLMSLIGFTTVEQKALYAQARQTGCTTLKSRVLEGITRCQDKLSSLSCMLHLELLPGRDMPLVVEMRDPSSSDAVLLMERVRSSLATSRAE